MGERVHGQDPHAAARQSLPGQCVELGADRGGEVLGVGQQEDRGHQPGGLPGSLLAQEARTVNGGDGLAGPGAAGDPVGAVPARVPGERGLGRVEPDAPRRQGPLKGRLDGRGVLGVDEDDLGDGAAHGLNEVVRVNLLDGEVLLAHGLDVLARQEVEDNDALREGQVLCDGLRLLLGPDGHELLGGVLPYSQLDQYSGIPSVKGRRRRGGRRRRSSLRVIHPLRTRGTGFIR